MVVVVDLLVEGDGRVNVGLSNVVGVFLHF